MDQILTPPEGGLLALAARSDLAVVIVDMQEPFLHETTPRKRRIIIDAHLELIAACRVLDIPVAALEMEDEGDTISELRRKLQLLRRSAFIKKRRADGFSDTTLLQTLQGWRAHALVLTGCMASACVLVTAISAKAHSFEVRTAEALVADADCDRIEIFGSRKFQKFGCLRPPELAALLGA